MNKQLVKVELNKSTDNPFYGLKNCLALYQYAGKGVLNDALLNACWNEVKNDREKREMFFVVLFSIGDITAREHNIFKGEKVDKGGNSQRVPFMDIIKWMRNKEETKEQFIKFLFGGLFNEFSSFDSLLANRVKTKPKSKSVISTLDSLSGDKDYVNVLATYCASIITGTNESAKYFLAKFLTRPRLSKRKKHKEMLTSTKKIMRQREFFLLLVSKKANLEFVRHEKYIEFTGYYDWRKKYNTELESVMFSSKEILKMDKQQFLAWLEKLPSDARYRVRKRLLDKEDKPKLVLVGPNKVEQAKWEQLPFWFLEWEKFKETKQTEVRVLEEKVRQTGNEDDKSKLEKVKKQAKVTVGAVNFADTYKSIIEGTVDKLKLQPFLDKVNLPYNTLVFMDDSSSMIGNRSSHGFTAFDFGAFISTICLMKNPDDSGRSLIGLFSSTTRMFSTMDSTSTFVNSIVRTQNQKISSEPLIKPEEHFLVNLQRMKAFFHSKKTGNGTRIDSIPDYVYSWVSGDPDKMEQIQNFPVWTVVTDNNWNNMHSPEASMNDFMMKCQRYFGFKPFVIAIDVSVNSTSFERFQGIENLMCVPANPAQIEQLLTNFRDLDIMDVYTPLQSLHRSNRYNVVKYHVL
jgi:hypothetical protein